MVCLFVVELIIHRKLSLSAADNFSACEHNNWHQCFWCQMGCMRLSMPHYTQCLNCEKLAGGWSFRQSETEQNCDVNCMYTADPPVHNLRVHWGWENSWGFYLPNLPRQFKHCEHDKYAEQTKYLSENTANDCQNAFTPWPCRGSASTPPAGV